MALSPETIAEVKKFQEAVGYMETVKPSPKADAPQIPTKEEIQGWVKEVLTPKAKPSKGAGTPASVKGTSGEVISREAIQKGEVDVNKNWDAISKMLENGELKA